MKILRMSNKSLEDKNHKIKKMNKLENIYKEIKEKDDIEKTSIICSNLYFRVFISISIPIMRAVEKWEMKQFYVQ
jgi:hypothetical protein